MDNQQKFYLLIKRRIWELQDQYRELHKLQFDDIQERHIADATLNNFVIDLFYILGLDD